MGLDILDLVFRLECAFGINLNRGDVDALFDQHRPPDLRLGDLFEHARRRAVRSGTTLLDGEGYWPKFQQVVSDSTGVDHAAVMKDTWLTRDLGSR